MSTNLLPHLERYSSKAKEPVASIIWLHGLGASGHDFEPLVPYLNLPEEHPIRFIFPHAPKQPVTINYGMVMPSWYDILNLSEVREVNMKQVQESVLAIHAFIEHEIGRGIPANKIMLIGFSQGGAISYHTALRYEKPLAGLMALSTYLLEPETLITEASISNKSIPIMIAHGRYDPVVPLNAGIRSREFLEHLHYQVEWFDYSMQHEVCPEEISQIAFWIKKTLKLTRG